MLVLSRKKNESIVIADQVRITVVEVRGDRVRLGIEAPREIPIHREEVHVAITSAIVAEKAAEESAEKPVNPDPAAGE